MRRFLIPLLAAGLPLSARAQISDNVVLLGHVDNYEFHSDVWGYRAPDGTELAIAGTREGTTVVDATNPATAHEIAFFPGPSSIWRDIDTYGTYAYVATEGGGGLQILDLTNPHAPTLAGTYSASFSTCHTIYIDKPARRLYASGTNNGLRVLNLTDPRNPVGAGSFNGFYLHDVFVRDGLCYGAAIGEGFMAIMDVSALPAITVLSQVSTPTGATHNTWLTDDGRHCLTCDEAQTGHVGVFDVQDRFNPFLVAQWRNPDEPNSSVHNVYVRGDFAHCAWYKAGYEVLNIQDPSNPIRAGYYDTYDGVGTYNGVWAVYPFQPSGVVYASDMETGLYLFRFATSIIEGTVSEAGSGAPIAAATVREPATGKTATSDAAGNYRLYVDDGPRTIVFEAFGYEPDTATVIAAEGTAVPLSASLVKIPAGSLQGVARALDTGLPLGGVRVAVEGSPLAVQTGASGTYGFASLPQGLVTVTAHRLGFSPLEAAVTIVASQAATQNFNLPGGVLGDDFENDQGWTVGGPGDDATAGLWTRVDPVGTLGGTVQPEHDHSPAPGVRAFVTGQGFPGAPVGASDVDGGQTTLVSPLLDLSGMSRPTLRYFRWYSNDSGPYPGEDVFRVDVSANGGASWVNLESLGATRAFWEEVTFDLAAYVPLTNQARLRFVASDEGGPSFVEGALDDIEIYEGGEATSVPGGGLAGPDAPADPATSALRLAASPNPFAHATALAFRLAGDTPVLLDIFDATGRRVRRLVAEDVLAAGAHAVSWDGRDDEGRGVAPGFYLARLATPGRTETMKILLAK